MLHLCAVPEFIVCLCFFQLLTRVDVWPLVFGVVFQGLLSPLICT